MTLANLWKKLRVRKAKDQKTKLVLHPITLDDKTGLPIFRYYPDPLSNGSIISSQATCVCCNKARGYMYAKGPYGLEGIEEEELCPWCIADGSAAQKLGCSFIQDLEAEVPGSVFDEIMQRTPGYETWQGEYWMCHCNDACIFLGEMTGERFAAVPDIIFDKYASENGFIEAWRGAREKYVRATDASVYEFRCAHCGEIRLHADAS